jgi:glycine/D-amino acid oxidase-like deaminating enzyme
MWRGRHTRRLDLETNQPFWPRRDGLPNVFPPLTQSLAADILIAGAGCTGAMLAYELCHSGLRVVVLDRRDAASGSSAASTGLLQYDTDTSLAELGSHLGPEQAARIYALGFEAIDRIGRFTSLQGRQAGFSRRESVYFASSHRDVERLRTEYELRRRAEFDVSWLDSGQFEAFVGFPAAGAIVSRGSAEVDPYRLTHAYLAEAALNGVHVFDRTAITRVGGGDGAFEVATNRGVTVRCSKIVWATGYEGIVQAPPRAKLASTWVLVSEPLVPSAVPSARYLMWETARPYVYVRWTEDHRLMIGGEDEPCAECHRSAWWFERKTSRLLQRARAMFPNLDLEIGYAWAGTFSRTDDGLPIIAERAEAPGQWLALGYGGNGLTFGAIAARLIGQCLTGHRPAELALFG